MRTVVIVAFVGIAAVTAAIVLTSKPKIVGDFSSAQVLPSLPKDEDGITADKPSVPSFTVDKTAAKGVDYKTKFFQSSSYWSFVQDALPDAVRGDADAQYFVSKAIDYCDGRNRLYFIRNGQRLSMEDGLAWAVKRRLPYDVAQEVYDRCHDFLEHPSGSDEESALRWLISAAKSGQPAAQSMLAAKILEQDMRRGFETASGDSGVSSGSSIDRSVPAHELLRQAVKSGDPEVLFTIGELMPALNPTAPDVQVDRFAWMLVACERGYDCSGGAEWVAVSCPSPTCGSISAKADVVQILSRDDWPAVQDRAREINASIDAGRWEDLGLGQ